MIPTIQIGPAAFPTGGLTYILGAYLFLSVIERAAKRLRLNFAHVYALGTVALVGGLIGARVLFVIEYWAAFRENLLGIVWPLTSGYNAWGGLLIGAAAGFFYGRYKSLPPARTLDALLPGLVTALMAISLADFLAGPGLGALTSVPWGVSQFGIRRHPVQVYELLVGAAALGVWVWRSRQPRPAAELALMTTAVYCAGRLFVDAYRAAVWITPNGLHGVQILCLLLLLLALFFLGYRAPSAAPHTE